MMAPWLTHDGPWMTHGEHVVDSSHLYGRPMAGPWWVNDFSDRSMVSSWVPYGVPIAPPWWTHGALIAHGVLMAFPWRPHCVLGRFVVCLPWVYAYCRGFMVGAWWAYGKPTAPTWCLVHQNGGFMAAPWWVHG